MNRRQWLKQAMIVAGGVLGIKTPAVARPVAPSISDAITHAGVTTLHIRTIPGVVVLSGGSKATIGPVVEPAFKFNTPGFNNPPGGGLLPSPTYTLVHPLGGGAGSREGLTWGGPHARNECQARAAFDTAHFIGAIPPGFRIGAGGAVVPDPNSRGDPAFCILTTDLYGGSDP